MKKYIFGLLVLLFTFSLDRSALAAESKPVESKIKVIINNNEVVYKNKPILVNSSLYLPVTETLKAFNNTPEYVQSLKGLRIFSNNKVYLVRPNYKTILSFDFNEYCISYEFGMSGCYAGFKIANPFIKENDITYVPISFLKEQLKFNVQKPDANTLIINGEETNKETGIYKAIDNYIEKLKAKADPYKYIGERKEYYYAFLKESNKQIEDLLMWTNLEKLINKKYWVDKSDDAWPYNTPFKNLEAVTVIQTKLGTITVSNGKKSVELWVDDSKYRKDFAITALMGAFYETNPYNDHKWSQKVWNAIRDQEVFIGMNQDMVIMSIGSPIRTNSTETRSGVYSQWVYDYGMYLYFDNNTLTSIQY
ncbi:stalk domain-containing protein [Cohnella sp. GCM10020058]|uniref:stalk domain-containing protein n=1 Tax=Cohnella sp. GCM10020058 TaxID=3317330 RepID=UPI00362A7F49